MQHGNIYRPTEDADGCHRQLLTDLGNVVLKRAKSIMQEGLSAGKTFQPKFDAFRHMLWVMHDCTEVMSSMQFNIVQLCSVQLHAKAKVPGELVQTSQTAGISSGGSMQKPCAKAVCTI